MALIDLDDIPEAALPVAGFRDYLQLEAALEPEDLQTDLLTRALEAAMLHIEARTGHALVARQFTEGFARARGGKLTLSRMPVVEIEIAALVRSDGTKAVCPARLSADGAPTVSVGQDGAYEIVYQAGFATMPADLEQAVLIFAAALYLEREAADLAQPRFQQLIAPYRQIRISTEVL